MNRIARSGIALAAFALTGGADAAPFTEGNLVIYRLAGNASGGASGTLTNVGNIVWLDEYTTNGVFVQSHMMPTNTFGAASPLIGAGTTFGSGLIGRSEDGRYILVAGYGATLGQITSGGLQSTAPTVVPRVAALVDASGNMDTSTLQTNAFALGDEVRSVATIDGTDLWLAGSTRGVRHTTRGSALATQLSTFQTNIRQLHIVSNTLYFSTAAGTTVRIGQIGTQPPPTTNGSFMAALPGVPGNTNSPFGFALFNLTGGAGPDTLYYTDSSASTIEKYSLVGTNWTYNGNFLIGGAIGLTGRVRVSGTTTNVDLWTTGGGSSTTGADSLWYVTDSGGYNAAPVTSGTEFIPLVTTPGQVSFRGITFAPRLADTALLSVSSGAFKPVGFAGGPFDPTNQLFVVSNAGSTSMGWTVSKTASWLNLSATNGTLAAGQSTNIFVSINANANSLAPGVYTDTLGFTNTTNGAGNTTRPVTLSATQLGVSPSTDFASLGPVGGGFTPGSKVYTLTNASAASSLTWGASKTEAWLDLSATSGTLAPGASTNITVSINATANSLPKGVYNDTVVFTNAVSDPGNATRGVTLTVGGGFAGGNLVVYRVGDGTVSLSASSAVVFLSEYTQSGDFVQAIPVSTNDFSAAGSATSEGLITRSTDGQYLVFAGYATNQGVASVASTSAATVRRVVARVDANGNIDTSTRLTDFASGNNPRGVASTDGNNIWVSGGAGGVRYATLGATTSTQLSASPTNIRGVNIFSNQLYSSAMSGAFRLFTVGPGLPTTGGQVCTNLPGLPTTGASYYSFVMFNLTGGADPVDTLYVASDETAGGVYKWSLVGGTWMSNGLVSASAARGVTGALEISGTTTNVKLFITSQGTLTGFTDTNGWNAAPAGTTNFTVAAPANTAFRGVAFTPDISATANLAVNPATDFDSAGARGGPFTPASKVYTVSNTGGSSMDWSVSKTAPWLDLSATSGTLLPGAATNITVSLNANANALPAGIHSDTVDFLNTSTGDGDTSRAVTLAISQLGVAPSDGLVSHGPAGGAFSPNSKIYTLTNLSSSASLTWGASVSENWLSLSAGSGVLSPNQGVAVTVSVNANANSLSGGLYYATVAFTNASPDAGNTTRPVSLTVEYGFCDDFSTFSAGNLVGQQGWGQIGGNSSLPLQIAGGVVGIPFGQTNDNQDAYKNIAFRSTLYAGFTLTVTNAPPGTNASFFVSLLSSNNGTGFNDARVNAHDVGGQYQLGIRYNGLGVNPFVFGGNLDYGTQYVVIVKAAVTNDGIGNVFTNVALYVAPTSGVEGDQTPYASQFCTGDTESFMGGFNISQFASATVSNAGVLIGKVCVNTSFAQVYNSLTGAPPSDPFTTWRFTYFGCTNCPQALPGADPDGDGMSNTNEFLAGFNPTNSAAYLRIISIVNSGSDVRVTYLGANGDSSGSPGPKTNVLEFTAGTGGGSYSNNFASTGQTNILSGGTGSGVITNMVDPGGATNVPSRYYRVRVLTQ